MSPHGLVQELLNRTEALWGFVSTAVSSACSATTSRSPARPIVEFDLEAMFAGEVYADFALLWLICHESRFEPEDDKADGVLAGALDPGRAEPGHPGARHAPRRGRAAPSTTLGRGLPRPPGQRRAARRCARASSPRADYYRQLLRLVYRLLFLFVAEDRDAAPPDAAAEEARDRYRDFYSMARLRRLAERLRGGPHPDLWRSFEFVCAKLADDEGCPELGLPFLGSSLCLARMPARTWTRAELANRDLLGRGPSARVHRAADGSLRQVDYRNLGSEELGSIYESLLELHPEFHHESGTLHPRDRRRQRAQDDRQLLHADLADHLPARLGPRPGARRGRAPSPTPRPRSWT